eukprot:13030077-Heterocapsa_arctica.AAC.1
MHIQKEANLLNGVNGSLNGANGIVPPEISCERPPETPCVKCHSQGVSGGEMGLLIVRCIPTATRSDHLTK